MEVLKGGLEVTMEGNGRPQGVQGPQGLDGHPQGGPQGWDPGPQGDEGWLEGPQRWDGEPQSPQGWPKGLQTEQPKSPKTLVSLWELLHDVPTMSPPQARAAQATTGPRVTTRKGPNWWTRSWMW